MTPVCCFIPKTYAVTRLDYSTEVFDLEPVLIQPAYIQCAEPLDKALKTIFVKCYACAMTGLMDVDKVIRSLETKLNDLKILTI